jgi:phytoene dehydrogenase-like protein
MAKEFDLILIGSGAGALTVASLAAQLRGQRVLVLERHFKAGGFTHAFRRNGFRWDVGLHYVGQMGSGSQTRRLFDLITGGNVRWSMLPDPLERFVYPELTFDLCRGADRFMADLIERFTFQLPDTPDGTVATRKPE